MNKNLNNQNDKGTRGGQMQNPGNRQNDTPTQGAGTNRVESWNKQNSETDKGIHPAEPSIEKNLNRERETQPMGKGADLNREKERMESSAEKTMSRDKVTNVPDSGSTKNTNSNDGSPSSRTQAMYNREPVSTSSTFQTNTHNPNLESKLVDELKAPAITGTALYVIAAILLIGWAVGFFYFNAGAAIHVLLILALISVLIKVVQGRSD